jgi:hypothetical protein
LATVGVMEDKQSIEDALLELYRKGFIKIEYDEKLQAKFSPTDAGVKYIEGIFGKPGES